jgi:hypothetical protein
MWDLRRSQVISWKAKAVVVVVGVCGGGGRRRRNYMGRLI